MGDSIISLFTKVAEPLAELRHVGSPSGHVCTKEIYPTACMAS